MKKLFLYVNFGVGFKDHEESDRDLGSGFVVCLLANLLMPRAGIAVFLFRFDSMLLWSSLGMLVRTVFELARKKT